MVSAIWSMPPYEASQMPLTFFLSFFKNHGLFKLKNRPQWYTVENRSKTYVNKIIDQISGEYFKNYIIRKVERNDYGVKIFYGGENEFFDYDKVVLATHADQTVSILKNLSDEEKNILTKFNYKNVYATGKFVADLGVQKLFITRAVPPVYSYETTEKPVVADEYNLTHEEAKSGLDTKYFLFYRRSA